MVSFVVIGLAMAVAVVVFLVGPSLQSWFRRGRRRPLGGPCAVCGYDLRGQSERCPECGDHLPFGGNRRMAEATARLTRLTRRGGDGGAP